MPDLKISQLPVASTPLAGTELVPIVQGGITEQTTVSDILSSTVPSGTASGVLYLDGSKVATSGTALAFNGTSLLVGKNSSDANNWGVQNYATNAFGSGMQLTYGGVGSAGLWVPAASSLAFGADAGSGTTELMRLTSTGLGIGTSSPTTQLQIAGASFAIMRLSAASNNVARVDFGTVASPDVGRISYDNTTNGFTFRANGSDALYLTSSGNLGLGVTPSASWSSGCRVFQIGVYSAVNENFGGYPEVSFNSTQTGSTSFVYRVGTNPATRFSQTNGAFQWFTAPSGTAGNAISFTQAMTLDASGRLIVGETATQINERLNVTGNGILVQSAAATNRALIGNFGGSDFIVGSYDNIALAFRTNNTERARITSGGDLLVGQTAAGYQNSNSCEVGIAGRFVANHVNGTSSGAFYAAFGYNSVGIGSITQDGTTAVLYNTASDRRLKQNIVPAPSASDVIDAIQIVSHDWKAAPDEHVTYGVIAQDLYALAPQAVSVGDAGDEIEKAWGVDYSKLVPMLIKEIQSLRARVAALESQP